MNIIIQKFFYNFIPVQDYQTFEVYYGEVRGKLLNMREKWHISSLCYKKYFSSLVRNKYVVETHLMWEFLNKHDKTVKDLKQIDIYNIYIYIYIHINFKIKIFKREV